MRLRNALFTLAGLALVAPAPAFARGEFDPTTEFEQHEWIPIHLGPLNLSITKAVAYLMIGSALTILLGLGLMRGKTINRRQTTGELIYDVAQTQIAEQGLPTKAIGRWFPYVATLMLFIFVGEPDRVHPAPADRRDVARRPDLGHLRGHLVALGDARARAARPSSSRTSRASAGTGPCATSRAGSPTRRSRCSR